MAYGSLSEKEGNLLLLLRLQVKFCHQIIFEYLNDLT